MFAAFPVLSELKSAIPDRKDVKDCFELPCKKSMAWSFHVESLLPWWSLLLRRGDLPLQAWILEDDAGFSGSLAEFIAAYREEEADFITHRLQTVEQEWIWRDVVSAGLKTLVPLHQRLRCAEHVQRFSARFLQTLMTFCLRGVSGWSEMSVPSLCSAAGLTAAQLRFEHIGPVFVFNGKVPEEAWPRICSEVNTRGRWWHALKW